MNTGTAIVVAGALIAAAIVGVSLRGTEEAPPGTQDAPPAHAASGTQASAPGLTTAPADQQRARLDEDMREARRLLKELLAKASDDASEQAPGARPPALLAKQQERFFELGRRYADGTATEKEVTELLTLAKDKALMARVVGDLERKIAENPDDVAVRMQLVEVQSARVHSAESITERAMLRTQVRDQLGQVLERDAENWDARYMRAVGISHSQRTPQGRAAAIKEFESLIELQQARSAEPRFATTYGQLAGVYLAEKDVARARAALESGIARYPDDKELEALLAKLPTSDD